MGEGIWYQPTYSPISFPESLFPLTSGRKTRTLGATISGMRHRCRLRSETGWAEFGYFLYYFKMVATRALVSRPLVKGNEDYENSIAYSLASTLRMRTAISLGQWQPWTPVSVLLGLISMA